MPTAWVERTPRRVNPLMAGILGISAFGVVAIFSIAWFVPATMDAAQREVPVGQVKFWVVR